jgi:hypothetical protein
MKNDGRVWIGVYVDYFGHCYNRRDPLGKGVLHFGLGGEWSNRKFRPGGDSQRGAEKDCRGGFGKTEESYREDLIKAMEWEAFDVIVLMG